MKQGASQSIWEGKIMPSILRGSKEHNEKVLAERTKPTAKARAKPAVTSKKDEPAVPMTTMKNDAISTDNLNGYQELFQKAQEVIASLELARSEAPAKLPEAPVKRARVMFEVPLNPSPLYAYETFDESSQSPQKAAPAPVILSPFSKAKQNARKQGVGLSEECRGVYSEEELERRVALLAQLNKKSRPL